MTTLVGYITEEKIYLGADTQYTGGDAKLPFVKRPKLIWNQNRWLGVTGACAAQEYAISLLNEVIGMTTSSAAEFIREELNKKFGEKEENPCDFFIVSPYEGVILSWDKGATIPVKTYEPFALGSGCEYALGAMTTVASYGPLTEHQIIYAGLAAAAKYDTGTNDKFQYVTIDRKTGAIDEELDD